MTFEREFQPDSADTDALVAVLYELLMGTSPDLLETPASTSSESTCLSCQPE